MIMMKNKLYKKQNKGESDWTMNKSDPSRFNSK